MHFPWLWKPEVEYWGRLVHHLRFEDCLPVDSKRYSQSVQLCTFFFKSRPPTDCCFLFTLEFARRCAFEGQRQDSHLSNAILRPQKHNSQTL